MTFVLLDMASVSDSVNGDDDGEQGDLVVNKTEESESIEQLREYLIEKLSHLDLSNKGVKRIKDRSTAANGGFSDIYRGSYRRKEVAIKVARQAVPVDERTLNV